MQSTNQSFWTDTGLIAVGEEQQRYFWAARLGVSVEELKSAVRATHSLSYYELKNYLDQYAKTLEKQKKHARN